jgi:hypothetical protein
VNHTQSRAVLRIIQVEQSATGWLESGMKGKPPAGAATTKAFLQFLRARIEPIRAAAAKEDPTTNRRFESALRFSSHKRGCVLFSLAVNVRLSVRLADTNVRTRMFRIMAEPQRINGSHRDALR